MFKPACLVACVLMFGVGCGEFDGSNRAAYMGSEAPLHRYKAAAAMIREFPELQGMADDFGRKGYLTRDEFNQLYHAYADLKKRRVLGI